MGNYCYDIRLKMYEKVYSNNDIFNRFIGEIKNIPHSELTEDDVVRSTDGVRINLKLDSESSKGYIIDFINILIKKYLLQYCEVDFNVSDIIGLYNITYVQDGMILIL